MLVLALVSWGCLSKAPQTGWLKQQVSHSPGGQKSASVKGSVGFVPSEGHGGASAPGPSQPLVASILPPWLADGVVLVSSCHLLHACLCVLIPHFIRTPVILD